MNEKESPINTRLEGGTYEIIQNRLSKYGSELRTRLDNLNQSRKEVFGSIETALLATERITTEHNCIPYDMISVGDYFIFGYNVHIGLKTEIKPSDVFAIYEYQNRTFKEQSLELINDNQFLIDFDNLYRYYKATQFVKFATIGIHLFMVFRVSQSPNDIKTFKWKIKNGTLEYIDNRSDHEFIYPDQHEFKWKKTTREQHQLGKHPHISIEDKIFVETVGGDLTIKIENNTDTGKGIYSEPVEDADQTLDDAEIYYSIIGNIIVLKMRPYQEKLFRYIVYNQKIKEARRIDALEDSCVLLPDDQGIIFANGYYLQTGEYKLFENYMDDMFFEKRIISPNGEDFLFTFFNKSSCNYILLSYSLIEQKVENPIICGGFALFDNGEMCYFKSPDEPQRFHSIQIWQTPYTSANFQIHTKNDSYLYKIGNKDIVQAMAECHELLVLLSKEDTYSGLYLDLVKLTTIILDSYYWLDKKDAFNLKEPIIEIKKSATSAIDEFEKVTKIRTNTQNQVDSVTLNVDTINRKCQNIIYENIDDFVNLLATLRKTRGEVISLKDLRYVDLTLIEKYDAQLEENANKISSDCIQFLSLEKSLEPYVERVESIRKSIDEVVKVIEINQLEEKTNQISSELELLIEIVSNLKIEDATQTAKIIDNISAIYSSFNQIRAAIKRKRNELVIIEGKAEFNAQIKLINQSVINYLDLCDIPEKADEYLSKLMVQLEELEGKFSDFSDFVSQITEVREEIYNAFGAKKISLIEDRNRRSNNYLQSAERILKAIQNRISRFENVSEINGYYASDLMIQKVRDIVENLLKIEDTVKADTIQSRLKTLKEDAIRQLKDKNELFVGGENLISFGKHKFTVNTQSLGLTMVLKDEKMYYHLTGTALFEQVKDERFLSMQNVWNQTLISENENVYRGEYLAYQVLTTSSNLEELTDNQLFEHLKQFAAQRYNEGYIKGVHDTDAFMILKELIQIRKDADLLRYSSKSRACAELFWLSLSDANKKKLLSKQIKGAGKIMKVFTDTQNFISIKTLLQNELNEFCEQTNLFDTKLCEEAAEYLFYEHSRGDSFVLNFEAANIYEAFINFLKQNGFEREYQDSITSLKSHLYSCYELIRDWVKAFVNSYKSDLITLYPKYIDEVSVTLLGDSFLKKNQVNVSLKVEMNGLLGSHSLIENQTYFLDYNEFINKLKTYTSITVPQYEDYVKLKTDLLAQYESELRLNEFKPRVLSSFVRNQLIDSVYLPLIGANLAKQIGAAGENKRTDLMGMLLLISPPGYGKTTLMEYIANRLGIIFMKINAPALGNSVISLDPKEATNAAAREELLKLNLAFEMGDNVMIYVDDIQHCNPEFLQKFISLADAQRKIEGTYKGQSKTYDFRGKKVCIVMAGNPYTESGEKFKIPDMLANRADTYNLGDILGDSENVFMLSYIENAMTSNPILARLAGKSSKDLYTLMKYIETGTREGLDFEASHSPEEITEYVEILKKLMTVREILLKVNKQYIYSAAQQDEYRTEPTFKLQGSYRNMNKLAEKIMPILNDSELKTLILSHYENESQTLATGAEANLLKFKDMVSWIDNKEQDRWNDIKQMFVKQQQLKGMGNNAQIAQALIQLESIAETLKSFSPMVKV